MLVTPEASQISSASHQRMIPHHLWQTWETGRGVRENYTPSITSAFTFTLIHPRPFPFSPVIHVLLTVCLPVHRCTPALPRVSDRQTRVSHNKGPSALPPPPSSSGAERRKKMVKEGKAWPPSLWLHKKRLANCASRLREFFQFCLSTSMYLKQRAESNGYSMHI